MGLRYQAPSVQDLGRLEVLTLGGPHSRCDGNSGTVGDNGKGEPQAPGFPNCEQVKGGGK